MAESFQSQPLAPVESNGVGIARTRRPLHKPEPPKLRTKEALAHIIAYLTSVQSELEDKTDPTQAGQTLLQAKRLSRTGTITADGFARPYEQGGDGNDENGSPLYVLKEAVEPEPAVDLLEFSGPAAAPLPEEEHLAGISPEVNARSAPAWREEDAARAGGSRPARGRGLLLSIVLFLLLLLGAALYFGVQPWRLWRGIHPGVHAPPPSAPPSSDDAMAVSDEALKIASLALEASHQGDFAKAAQLFAEAQHQGIVLPGMRYQAALVALKQDNLDAANIWIDQSIAVNESVAECLYLRAKLQGVEGDYEGAAESFAEAARRTPFMPRNYFFQAECLRRNGKPASAIPVFEQALRRRPSQADAELIVFKLHLAKLDTGVDSEFQEELADQLLQKPIAGNTLLLAAANEINQRAYSLAAEYLRIASQVLPPAVLKIRESDFVFASQARQSALAALLASASAADPASSRERKALIDPATLGLEEADPANW